MTEAGPLRVLIITSRPLVVEYEVGRKGRRKLVRDPISLRPVHRVRDGLRKTFRRLPLTVRYLAWAKAGQVQEALLEPYDIVHFVGHGSDDGRLLLETETGTADFLSPERAARLMRGSGVRLAIISACHSSAVAEALRDRGVLNVVAVDEQWVIDARAADCFNHLFYAALARGDTLMGAFEAGLDAVSNDPKVGDDAPQPKDEKTGQSRPRWSHRFRQYFGDDTPLVTEKVAEPYKESWPGCRNNLLQVAPFVGRQVKMAEAVAALTVGRLVTLTGTGGIGKTSLGIEAARWHAEREACPDGVFWVELEGVRDPATLAQAIAETWEEGWKLDPRKDPIGQVAARLRERRALFLLDNFDDLLEHGAESAAKALRTLLEGTVDLRFLVTCREPLGLEGWERGVTVEEMEPPEAAELFLEYAPVAQWEDLILNHASTVREICAALDHYPLALALAAANLDGPGVTPGGLLADIPRRMEKVLRRMERRGVPERLKSVWVSLDISYERLSAKAKTLFAHLAAFPGGAGEYSLKALESDNWREAAREVVNKRLAWCREERYGQLNPVRVFAQEKLDEGEGEGYRERVAEHFLELASAMNARLNPEQRRKLARQIEDIPLETAERRLMQGALIDLEAERSNLLHYIEWANDVERWELVWRLTRSLTNFFVIHSLWSDWQRVGELAVRAAREGVDKEAESVALGDQGNVHLLQGRWDDAITCFGQSLTIYRDLGDRQGEALTLMNLGNVYLQQRRREEALEQYEVSLRLFHELDDRHGEGQTLGNQGNVYAQQDRWDDAIACYEQSLRVFRELGDRYGEAQMVGNLGNVYLQQGRREEALEQYEVSLRIFRELDNRHGEGQTLTNLGTIYRQQSRWNDAIACYEQSLTIFRELGDPHGEGQTLMNLGTVYRQQGRWDDAIACYEQSLAIFRDLGDRHSEEGTAMMSLGIVYCQQGRWDDAIACYEQSLRIFRELGDRHNEGLTLGNIGRVYWSQSRKEKAVALWREALTKLHPDSPKRQQVTKWLAETEN